MDPLLYNIYDNVMSWFFYFFGITFPIYALIGVIGIKGFLTITRYEKGDSFLYRLNPVTKIAMGLVVMTIAAITIWWVGAILTVIGLGIYLTLKDGKRKFFLGLFLTISSIIGSAWGIATYTPYSILHYAFGNFNPVVVWVWPSYFSVMGYQHFLTLQGMEYGFQVAMRTTPIFLYSLILVMTTTPSQIVRALTKIKLPIEVIFSMVVAMRSLPRIFEAIDTSVKMQFLKGRGYGASKWKMPIYMLVGVFYAIVPTLIYLLRGAKYTQMSADTRAFRAYKDRSYLYDIKFSREDYIMLALFAIGIVLAIVATTMGYGRAVPYVGY
ncbi:Energy-coupling factor transporter transmembrane protein EcfT [Sulfuracidifex tepidarius]|uniref:Energy-coupling factor transporter transmembrane protein EcfT n=1 Tax=Sulfuracidifex tepidarius TaxID=1294262 RepID=A0A510DXI8_9CREN|nr:energy-coupling factor transporter transmembrane protein EcfT [Sulfuracidifex tepidarius]BBG24925.1 Energy-coupling factor transporter transmembrane protein EcfT [Sulfuracidifex tepidarius]